MHAEANAAKKWLTANKLVKFNAPQNGSCYFWCLYESLGQNRYHWPNMESLIQEAAKEAQNMV
jgi:hypothetical protein